MKPDCVTKEENLGRLCAPKGTLAQIDGDSAGCAQPFNKYSTLLHLLPADDTMKR